MITEWDKMAMRMAIAASKKSKDPNTKVGCVIVSPDRRSYSVGFNGFPPSIDDDIDVLARLTYFIKHDLGKDDLVIHAEMNAMLNAGHSLFGHTLYCAHIPCASCAKHILAARIRRVVTLGWEPTTDMGCNTGLRILKFGGVEYEQINEEDWQ